MISRPSFLLIYGPIYTPSLCLFLLNETNVPLVAFDSPSSVDWGRSSWFHFWLTLVVAGSETTPNCRMVPMTVNLFQLGVTLIADDEIVGGVRAGSDDCLIKIRIQFVGIVWRSIRGIAVTYNLLTSHFFFVTFWNHCSMIRLQFMLLDHLHLPRLLISHFKLKHLWYSWGNELLYHNSK